MERNIHFSYLATALTHWVNLTRSMIRAPVIGSLRIGSYENQSGSPFANAFKRVILAGF